jgi:hypothetical protein
MPDEKPITDPEMIAAYVKTAMALYRFDEEVDAIEIDNPPSSSSAPAAPECARGLRLKRCGAARSRSTNGAPSKRPRAEL